LLLLLLLALEARHAWDSVYEAGEVGVVWVWCSLPIHVLVVKLLVAATGWEVGLLRLACPSIGCVSPPWLVWLRHALRKLLLVPGLRLCPLEGSLLTVLLLLHMSQVGLVGVLLPLVHIRLVRVLHLHQFELVVYFVHFVLVPGILDRVFLHVLLVFVALVIVVFFFRLVVEAWASALMSQILEVVMRSLVSDLLDVGFLVFLLWARIFSVGLLHEYTWVRFILLSFVFFRILLLILWV